MAGFEGNYDNDLMRLESQDSESASSDSEGDLLPKVDFNLPKHEFNDPPRKGLLTSTVHKCLNDPDLEKAVDDYNALSTEEKRIFDLKVEKIIRNYHKKIG